MEEKIGFQEWLFGPRYRFLVGGGVRETRMISIPGKRGGGAIVSLSFLGLPVSGSATFLEAINSGEADRMRFSTIIQL